MLFLSMMLAFQASPGAMLPVQAADPLSDATRRAIEQVQKEFKNEEEEGSGDMQEAMIQSFISAIDAEVRKLNWLRLHKVNVQENDSLLLGKMLTQAYRYREQHTNIPEHMKTKLDNMMRQGERALEESMQGTEIGFFDNVDYVPKKQEVPEQNQGNAQDLPLAVQALFEADESITLSEVLNRLLAAEEAYKQASDQGEKNNIARAILFALEMLLGGEKNLNQTDANALGMIADIAQTIRNGM
jgi:hypothetical protein